MKVIHKLFVKVSLLDMCIGGYELYINRQLNSIIFISFSQNNYSTNQA